MADEGEEGSGRDAGGNLALGGLTRSGEWAPKRSGEQSPQRRKAVCEVRLSGGPSPWMN